MPKVLTELACDACGVSFVPSRNGQRFHSKECRRAHWGRQHRAANVDQYKAWSARWRRDNLPHLRQKNALWAAARLASFRIPFTPEQFKARMDFYGNACWMCRGPFESIDHVKPLSKGGGHFLANLRPACRSCNSRKHDTWLGPEWAGSLRSNHVA